MFDIVDREEEIEMIRKELERNTIPSSNSYFELIFNKIKEEQTMSRNWIKKVIFNDPATIILWRNGDKTIVKCSEHDTYDPEKGLAMAIAKHALGNHGNYYEFFKKYLPEYYKESKEHKSCTGCAYENADLLHPVCLQCFHSSTRTKNLINWTSNSVKNCDTCKYEKQAISDYPCCQCTSYRKTYKIPFDKWEPKNGVNIDD